MTINKKGLIQKYRTRFIIGLFFLVLIVLARFFHLTDYVTLEQFKHHRAYIKLLVERHYPLSVISFIFTYILIVALSVPLAAVLTIISGFLFGVLLGALYSNIGATVGGTIAFLIARYVLGDFVQERYAQQLKDFNREVDLHGAWYLMIIHAITLVPFFVVNTLAGLTRISLLTFIWTTSLGVIPGSLLYAYAGRKLMSIESVKEIFSSEVIALFAVLLMLALLAVIWKKKKKGAIVK